MKRILDQFRVGEVGTPEFADVIFALVQMAEIACKGALKCVAIPDTAGSSAAALNAAESGTYKVAVSLQIQDEDGNVQRWYNAKATATPSETVADTDVSAPKVNDQVGATTIQFTNGEATVELTYDTGEDKTYAVGDKVGLTVVATVMGIPGSIVSATFTDTIAA